MKVCQLRETMERVWANGLSRRGMDRVDLGGFLYS